MVSSRKSSEGSSECTRLSETALGPGQDVNWSYALSAQSRLSVAPARRRHCWTRDVPTRNAGSRLSPVQRNLVALASHPAYIPRTTQSRPCARPLADVRLGVLRAEATGHLRYSP